MPKIKEVNSSNILWPRHQTFTAVQRLTSQIKGSPLNIKQLQQYPEVCCHQISLLGPCNNNTTRASKQSYSLEVFSFWVATLRLRRPGFRKRLSGKNHAAELRSMISAIQKYWRLENSTEITYLASIHTVFVLERAGRNMWIHGTSRDKLDLDLSLLPWGNQDGFRWDQKRKLQFPNFFCSGEVPNQFLLEWNMTAFPRTWQKQVFLQVFWLSCFVSFVEQMGKNDFRVTSQENCPPLQGVQPPGSHKSLPVLNKPPQGAWGSKGSRLHLGKETGPSEGD